jgi:glutathione S-transferase
MRYEGEVWPTKKVEMPLGQMPVLEIYGAKLPQSITIGRFLAKQFQLAGNDNFEQAKVDAVVDTIIDIMSKIIPIRLEQDETKKQELMKNLPLKNYLNIYKILKV